jgi:hypothetical protein
MPFEVLTIQQSDMITMLINGENITDIARKLNINRNTVYNWIKKENIKAELDRRKQELTNQGNQLIMKDLTTYIGNIKDLANDKSDKRVCLAANQYLINRIYGNPTNRLEVEDEENTDNTDATELELQISKFKKLAIVK